MDNLNEKLNHLASGFQQLDENDQVYIETLAQTIAKIPLPISPDKKEPEGSPDDTD
jgi:hypothetical protein